MTRRKKNMLGAFLLAPILLTAGVMGVGETQARYAETAVYNTVLYGAPGAVSSDCLISGGQQTILLGEHSSDTALSVTFTLESTRDFAERLQWHCSGAAQVDVQMELWMESGEGSLSEDSVLQLTAGSRAEICMTLTPAEPVEEPTQVSVRVLCGTLEGTFRTTLLPVPPQPEETEPTEPAEPVEPTEPVDPTEPTDPSEPSEPVEEQPAALLTTEQEAPAEETEVPQEGLQIRTFRQMEREDLLPVKLELTGVSADRMELGLDGGSFPEFTRYSLDGGESWYLLYYGGTVEAPGPETVSQEGVSWSVMLDLSAAGLEGQELCLLEARVYAGEAQTAAATAEVELMESVGRARDAWVLTKPRWDSQSAEEETATEPSEGQDAAEPSESQESGEVPAESQPEELSNEESTPTEPAEEPTPLPLDPNASFTLPLPLGWEDCEITYEITYMAADETGVTYTPVILDPMSLCARRGEDLGTLIVWVGQNLPAAGKYRLTVYASYEGICFDPMEETFFINYYPKADTQSAEVTDYD